MFAWVPSVLCGPSSPPPQGLFDPCTPVRSAYAAALATLLANSVLTSQAAVDAAARAAAQSRVHRMRRADVDDTIDIGMGAGGPDDAKIKTSKSSRSRGQADSKAAAKPSADAGGWHVRVETACVCW